MINRGLQPIPFKRIKWHLQIAFRLTHLGSTQVVAIWREEIKMLISYFSFPFLYRFMIKRAQGRNRFGMKNFKKRWFRLTNHEFTYHRTKGALLWSARDPSNVVYSPDCVSSGWWGHGTKSAYSSSNICGGY